MTTNSDINASCHHHERGPFTRLVRELSDLDHAPIPPTTVVYKSPDGHLATIIECLGGSHRLRLTALDEGGQPLWEISCSSNVPNSVQLLAFYAALNADAGDEAALLRRIGDAWGLNLRTDPTPY